MVVHGSENCPTMSLLELTDKTSFINVCNANEGKLIVVDFFATWCG